MDPSDPNTLYVAFYHRLRKPWTFQSGGPGGGIFKSTDGGETWRELTRGLPTGETGRIGLSIYRRDPSILMAIVEAERTGDLSEPGSGIYRSEDAGESWTYINTYNNRPFYYSQIRINPSDDQRVYVLTTRFMVSEDGGRTLRNGSEDQEVHGDFHAMWIDPNDGDRYYLGADKGSSITHDHGRSFELFDNFAIGQYYRIGVDMRDPYYVYGGLQDNGTFGGPSFSRDVRGILNDDNWKLHWGDGQDVQVDPTDWRVLYTEAENGSFRRYDVLTHEFSAGPPEEANTVNYAEVVGAGSNPDSVFRFNWSAPLVMSPHDPHTIYLGGNFLFRTTDRGESWRIISPDLSTRDPEKTRRGGSGGITPDNTGAETHGTITSLSESSVIPGVIWAVTDDGNVQLTRDNGRTWTNARAAIRSVPAGIWADRIEASHFDPARAYVVFDGHRSDTFSPWAFRTDDYGQTWTDITSNLPAGHSVHVIREDLRNPDLLFLGTEFEVFVSLDRGARWTRLMNGMPTVAIQDLVIHPRDNDLIAGTHGRSIFILDDITPLQQLTDDVLASDAHLFRNRPATIWENRSRGGQRGHQWFAGENPPTIVPTSSLPRAEFRNSAMISYYLGAEQRGEVKLEISAPGGEHVHTAVLPGEVGIHRYQWDLRFDPPPLTDDERRRVAERFEEEIRDDPERRAELAESYDAFRAAGSERERREAMSILLEDRNSFSREFGRRESGGPGTYRVTLIADGDRYHGTLSVRADPIAAGAGDMADP